MLLLKTVLLTLKVGERSIDRSTRNLQDTLPTTAPLESTASTITLPYTTASTHGRMSRIKDPGTPGTPYFNRINIITFLNQFKTACIVSSLEKEIMFEILPEYYSVSVGLFIRTIPK
jgi:hypothetical protein